MMKRVTIGIALTLATAAAVTTVDRGLAAGPQIPIVIGFDEMTGMTSISRNAVPEGSRVSTNYLSRFGVVFRSTPGYVAVVNLGKRDSVSVPNGIGGVSAEGKLSYDSKNPIFIGFFNKDGSGKPAVTDYVSVTCDRNGAGKQVHLIAYDVDGNQVAQDDKADNDGATLSVHAHDVHSVTFFGTTDDDGAAIDNVTFDPVTAPGGEQPK